MRTAFALVVLLVSCRSLPREFDLPAPTRALPAAEFGVIAETEFAFARKHGTERSGFFLLDRNDDALEARLALIDHAQVSLDLQYFIWHGDESGSLLAKRILMAADRGVRVRLLIDDLVVLGQEKGIAALDQHLNVEVRVYNPWQVRDRLGAAAGFEFVVRMKSLNQRMHNKVFVADNRIAIIGGRNLGDEYFGLMEKYNFNDLDVLTVGPISRELSTSFDDYWNGPQIAPGRIFADSSIEKLEKERTAVRKRLESNAKLARFLPLDPREWSAWYERVGKQLHAGTARIIADDPAKEGVPAGYDEFADSVRAECRIVTAYFIPQADGIATIRGTVECGARVRILTNSLASTDGPVANTGYKKYRRKTLDAGAELYESRHDAAIKQLYETAPVQGKHLGLHTKAIVGDRRNVYIGAMNLDPRSVYLNTEIGLWIVCESLAEEAASLMERDMAPDNAGGSGWTTTGSTGNRARAGCVRNRPAEPVNVSSTGSCLSFRSRTSSRERRSRGRSARRRRTSS
jgi:putative cardiolipin synthase